jgi:hypothetical protein
MTNMRTLKTLHQQRGENASFPGSLSARIRSFENPTMKMEAPRVARHNPRQLRGRSSAVP